MDGAGIADYCEAWWVENAAQKGFATLFYMIGIQNISHCVCYYLQLFLFEPPMSISAYEVEDIYLLLAIFLIEE